MAVAAGAVTPHGRRRSTRAEIAALDDALYAIAAAHRPLTVRNAFYLAVAAGLVPKEETTGYRHVQRRLLVMRRSGRIPRGWVTDESRYAIRAATTRSYTDFLAAQARLYRLDLWAYQRVRVQVWCEKLAIAGVMDDVTNELCVPLYPARGFSSEAFLVEAAEEIHEVWQRWRQRTVLLYFGDHDPSGALIDPAILRRLRELLGETGAGEALESFRRVAVLPEQIAAWGLPTRPTKRGANTHAKRFRDPRSVEIDAVPPNTLRRVLRDAIMEHADARQMRLLERIEAEERKYLEIFAGTREADGVVAALGETSRRLRAASMREMLAAIAQGRLADGTTAWADVFAEAGDLAGISGGEVAEMLGRHRDENRPHLAVRRTAAWLLQRLRSVQN
jgi:hypothetical protein